MHKNVDGDACWRWDSKITWNTQKCSSDMCSFSQWQCHAMTEFINKILVWFSIWLILLADCLMRHAENVAVTNVIPSMLIHMHSVATLLSNEVNEFELEMNKKPQTLELSEPIYIYDLCCHCLALKWMRLKRFWSHFHM